MKDFLPYITGDGSVGLFSEDYDDIFHSASGAYSEAVEKFINPLEIDFRKDQNVLDICYGLGYNSKAFLNLFKKYDKKITIDCLDINEDLFFLSPFIKHNNVINTKKNLNNIPDRLKSKISHYIKFKHKKKYKLNKIVNQIIIKNLYDQFADKFFQNIFLQEEYLCIFDKNMLNFAKRYHNLTSIYIKTKNKMMFLHNIYYKYITYRYKYLLNIPVKMNFMVGDARNSILKINKQYDYIFLDAFTTDKCPQLWSIDFIKELYNHTKNDGVLVTYSKSVIVRNTFLQAGFYTGKILDKNNNCIGTIASKAEKKVKNKFNDYELGLLNTKAGIPYRDELLNLSSKDILLNHEKEKEESNLESSSKYIKRNRKIKNEI